MTDETYLKLIKEKIKKDFENDTSPVSISFSELVWLTERAEKAERMEMMYENTGAIFNRQFLKERIEEQQKEIERLESTLNL